MDLIAQRRLSRLLQTAAEKFGRFQYPQIGGDVTAEAESEELKRRIVEWFYTPAIGALWDWNSDLDEVINLCKECGLSIAADRIGKWKANLAGLRHGRLFGYRDLLVVSPPNDSGQAPEGQLATLGCGALIFVELAAYLRELQRAIDTEPPDGPAQSAGEAPAAAVDGNATTGHTMASAAIRGDELQGAGELTPEERRRRFEALRPAVKNAYWAYRYAEGKLDRPDVDDRIAHEYLREYGVDSVRKLNDYTPPPKLGTFRRYLSEARDALGEQKYDKRAGRRLGPCIVRGDEVEYQSGDGD